MKKVLVIGSAVADVIIRLEDHLPVTGEDVHVLSQKMQLGGCAYNVSDMIRHFKVPCIPFFPVGTGAYGDFIRSQFRERGIESPVPAPAEDNGCCYCFIEAGGERTFISYHGAEYRFYPEWFDLLDADDISSVYICGLEIEEPTGPNIVSFLEKNPSLTVFFGPGPRIMKIASPLMDRIFALRPILHLNETEALEYTGLPSVSQAAAALYARTENTVIITLGKDGCLYFDGEKETVISAFPARQADTIGAGDAHIGAVIASLARGFSLPEAIRTANRVSAAVVETEGALLTQEQFDKLQVI